MAAVQVGVIGAGIMGGAMAANLAKAGHAVTGCDPDAGAQKALEANGCAVADTPAAVAAASEFVILSLATLAAFRDVVDGPEGLTSYGENSRVVIEMSTLPIAEKEWARAKLEAAGHDFLDVPISGTGVQAADATIVLLASGDEAAYERAAPVFDTIARSKHYLGDFGNGSRMKFVANLLVAVHTVAAAEALVLGMKSGLDPETVYKVINDGAGTSRMFNFRGKLMAEQAYTPAFMKNGVWLKDMAAITDFARDIDCPTPLFGAAAPVFLAALAQGRDMEDMAAVCAVMEEWARVERG